MKRYCVYVDGFNLYYRSLRKSPYRWLNLKLLFENLKFDSGQLAHIKYFTSKVSPRSGNLDIHTRQNIYLRALATIPECSVHFGQFKKRKVKGALLDDENRPGRIVTIEKFEEKGSDVNIANHMLADGFLDRYDAAILISNDSDLAGTLDLIKEHVKKPVGLVNKGSVTIDLKRRATFFRTITDEILVASQFPPEITDSMGAFHRPKNWG
jgi:uncharacterized LabA/DUF88 family protein